MDVMDTVEIVEIAASPALMGLGETAMIAALLAVVLASLAAGYLHEMRAGRVDPARQLANAKAAVAGASHQLVYAKAAVAGASHQLVYAKAAVAGTSHQLGAVKVRFLTGRRDRAREERAAAIQARLDRNCSNWRYVA